MKALAFSIGVPSEASYSVNRLMTGSAHALKKAGFVLAGR
jgi:hypothetical protein